MQKSSLSLVLLALICGSLGWWTGRQQTAAERVDVRRELLDEISVNRSLREECFNNLRNQFTPGFRFAQVLPELGEDVPLYRVALTSFVSPERLERAGTTLLRQTSQARLFRQGVAGQWDFGQICPGSLELANVDVTQQTYVIGALRLHAGLLGETPPPVPTAASPPPVAPNGWPVSPHPALPPSMMNINPYATALSPADLFSR